MKVFSVLFIIMFSVSIFAQDTFRLEALQVAEAENTPFAAIAWNCGANSIAQVSNLQLSAVAMMGGGDGGGGGIAVLTPEMIKQLYPHLDWARLPAWQRSAIEVNDGKLFIDLAKQQVEDVLLVDSDLITLEDVRAEVPRGILAVPVEKVENIMTFDGDIVEYAQFSR